MTFGLQPHAQAHSPGGMKISCQFGSILSSLTILRRVSIGTLEALMISASRKRYRRVKLALDRAWREDIGKGYKDR
jgi:hypothetical protein